MYKVGILTLGCKVNTCESEQIREELVTAGFEIVDFEEEADVYLINTCSVTNIADRKSRQMLHKARKMNPNAVVVATGCYVQVKGEQVVEAGDADLVIGNNHKGQIAGKLLELLNRGTSEHVSITEEKNSICGETYIDDISKEQCFEEMELKEFPEKSRAFIKIEDGCNQFCSYCIIPYARGRVRSRDEESIIKEASGLAEQGIHEIVLTGIHLSSYGRSNYEAGMKNEEEFNYGPLLHLIEELAKVDGIERIRLGSLEPRIISEEFADKLKNIDKFCPHFHLALQSGSDTVLKRMNRHYTTKVFYEKCELLRRIFDRPAITTDIITGFPGETEEEFAESLEFYGKVNFSKMHIFKFSRRAGTVADKMSGQIVENVKHERSVMAQELDDKQHRAYMESFIGEEQEVLFEEYIDGYFKGLTTRYVPVMVKIGAELNEALGLAESEEMRDRMINEIFNVKISGFYDVECLLGEVDFS